MAKGYRRNEYPTLDIRQVQKECRRPSFTHSALARLPSQAKTGRLAVLLTTEFEGIGQNGGVGTYYREVARKLAETDWLVLLVILGGFLRVAKAPESLNVDCILDLTDVEQVLDLRSIHRAIRRVVSRDPNRRTGLDCLFLLQALEAHYPQAKIYAEFHEMFGFGQPSVQAKRAGFFSDRIGIGVTMHSGHEWIFDANRALIRQESRPFLRIAKREELSFGEADLAMYPSDSLHQIVSGFGWQTEGAIRIPYFIPIQTQTASARGEAVSSRGAIAEIIFFGRLEERKGLFEFIEAVQALQRESKTRFRITFLGKSIRLFSLRSTRTTSRDYIHSQLGDDFSYTIISDLSSRDAIAYVQAAAPSAVVCLASPSDNFPNAALEMGQIPVALVVSDTLGFRQTLSLVEREAGVIWFKASSATSLRQGLDEALANLGRETITVASTSRLEAVNRQLQATRMALMEDCFRSSLPTDTVLRILNLEHDEEPDSRRAYSNGIQKAREQGIPYLLSSLVGSSPGLEGSWELQRAAQCADADLVLVGSELGVKGLLCHDALSLTDLLAADFQPPGCLLLRTQTFSEFPTPPAADVAQLHQQLVAAAVLCGKKIAVLPYPLPDRPAEAERSQRGRVDEATQADLAKYLAAIPTGWLSKREVFHLMLSNQQLQASLTRLEPGESARQNASNLLRYLAIPARSLAQRYKRHLRRLISR